MNLSNHPACCPLIPLLQTWVSAFLGASSAKGQNDFRKPALDDTCDLNGSYSDFCCREMEWLRKIRPLSSLDDSIAAGAAAH
jgi:hypothetical protein